MKGMFEKAKDIKFTDTTVKITSALNDESKAQIEALAEELCSDYEQRNEETAVKNDMTALFRIGYGLYGYVYDGENLPDDFICPLCKHGVADFEPIK